MYILTISSPQDARQAQKKRKKEKKKKKKKSKSQSTLNLNSKTSVQVIQMIAGAISSIARRTVRSGYRQRR
jgi:hypothetical protein